MQLAREVERHEEVEHGAASSTATYIKQKAERHASEDPSLVGQIPTESIPFEMLGGFGTLIAGGLALWQRQQAARARAVACEVAEQMPEEAKKTLKKNKIS